MLKVHEENIRVNSLNAKNNEFIFEDGIQIIVPKDSSDVIVTAAKDLVSYFFESMNVGAIVKRNNAVCNKPCIFISLAKDTGEDLGEYAAYKGYKITVSNENVNICGFDDRGVASAIYRLEEIMTDRKAPFVKHGIYESKPMFSPMMVHSGYGLDDFPDAHLQKIAHEGRDAILVYTRGVDESKRGPLDFNTLVYRAAKYGIDVYAYSDMHITVHPEDEGAEGHFEGVYGKIFKNN